MLFSAEPVAPSTFLFLERTIFENYIPNEKHGFQRKAPTVGPRCPRGPGLPATPCQRQFSVSKGGPGNRVSCREFTLASPEQRKHHTRAPFSPLAPGNPGNPVEP